MAASKGTKKTSSAKKTSAKSASSQATKKSTETQKKPVEAIHVKNSSEKMQNTLLALILIGVVLTLVVSMFMFVKVSEIDEKVSKLDEFFQLIAPDEYGSSADREAPTQGQDQGQQESLDIDISGARTLGDEDAPVTMIKFSDFRCGFCTQFEQETFGDIKENYIDTGVVKFVYMDLPVVGGEDAANAAWCAEDQGQFWEFKEGLFDLGPRGITDQSMSSLAGDLGMNVDEYEQCYQSQEFSDRVSSETQIGQENGLTGTPSFVVNGEVVVGAQPYSAFQQIIEAELS